MLEPFGDARRSPDCEREARSIPAGTFSRIWLLASGLLVSFDFFWCIPLFQNQPTQPLSKNTAHRMHSNCCGPSPVTPSSFCIQKDVWDAVAALASVVEATFRSMSPVRLRDPSTKHRRSAGPGIYRTMRATMVLSSGICSTCKHSNHNLFLVGFVSIWTRNDQNRRKL